MDTYFTPMDDVPRRAAVVVGLPLDENSSFLRGASQGPAAIRRALHSGSANLCAENGVDLSTGEGWRDVGDLALGTGSRALDEIEAAVGNILNQGARVAALGGDHSVTLPVVRAYARRFDGLNILHLDAHADLYEEYDGSRLSHACPFARIMEAGLARRLVQVGIRTLTPHLRAQAERFGVEIVEMRQFPAGGSPVVPHLPGPVYLSLDLDVLDPAFAPGVSHHEPGGMSTRQVLEIIQRLEGRLVGADIVELNPARDVMGITAMAGAKFLKEILALLISHKG